MTTQTQPQSQQILEGIINRLAEQDPTWQRYLRRQPAYRYYLHKGTQDRCFWTTEPVECKGKRRFASGVYRYLKTKQAYKLTKERYHARRKDAKARALLLWEQTLNGGKRGQ